MVANLIDFSEKPYLDEVNLQRWLALPGNLPIRHFRDTGDFEACGGRLLEHLLFRAMLDSLQATEKIPPLPQDGKGNKMTRYRRRWAANRKNERTMEAREWINEHLPGLWRGVFAGDPIRIINWLRLAWDKIDGNPQAAKGYRTLVSEALIERELPNEA